MGTWHDDRQTYRQFHDSAWRFDMRTPHVHTHHLLIHAGRQAGRQAKGKQTNKHVCVNVWYGDMYTMRRRGVGGVGVVCMYVWASQLRIPLPTTPANLSKSLTQSLAVLCCAPLSTRRACVCVCVRDGKNGPPTSIRLTHR